MDTQLSYWAALAHTPKVKTVKKNEIIVRLFNRGLSIVDFFQSDPGGWEKEFGLTPVETHLFEETKAQLANFAFMVEDLLEQGYDILPITSQKYSPTLKENLGRRYAPPVLYAKGNVELMHEKTVAIVGSRKANSNSLNFTDNVAKKAVDNSEVVVSGFAKGVDKQALDSALKYGGQSIVVLPQGITTFKTGYKKYYQQILDGTVLVLSTFHPKAPWSVQLAMARNPIIYGLASDIYVAESSEKGGTWSGVMDGLRKGRTIYIRQPQAREKNANEILISKGGKPVDENGNTPSYIVAAREDLKVSEEPEADRKTTEEKIIDLLKTGVYDAKTIVGKLGIDWSPRQVASRLKENADIKTIKERPLKYTYEKSSSGNQLKIF